jgi:hypothetical protein
MIFRNLNVEIEIELPFPPLSRFLALAKPLPQ